MINEYTFVLILVHFMELDTQCCHSVEPNNTIYLRVPEKVSVKLILNEIIYAILRMKFIGFLLCIAFIGISVVMVFQEIYSSGITRAYWNMDDMIMKNLTFSINL